MKDRLNADLKSAMLARDSFLTDLLKGLKSAILNQEIAEQKRENGLDDTEIEVLFAKEAKKRLEAAAMYEQGGNQEMANKERRENEIILKYLPKQLSEEEIAELVKIAISQMNVSGMQEMGKVIGAVKAKAGSSADGALIAKITKATLQ